MSAEAEVSGELVEESLVTITNNDDSDSSVTESGPSSTETDRALSVNSPRDQLWRVVSTSMINLFLPFVNGMMLGFGEIFAHELGFRWGWSGARIYQQTQRYSSSQTEAELVDIQVESSRRKLLLS